MLLEEPLAVRRAMLEEVFAQQAAHTVVSSTPAKTDAPGNQGTLCSLSLRLRRNRSASAFARLVLASVERLSSAEQLEQAYVDARARGNEGVMLKAAASLYQPGRRGLAWLKLKRELATLDVVVTRPSTATGSAPAC